MSAGPDKLVDTLAAGLQPQHGKMRLHFYPFGSLARTVEWINDYRTSRWMRCDMSGEAM